MDRLQIEICTYKRGGELALLLESLRRQTYKDWDLIIVDGQKENPVRNQKYINDLILKIKMDGHGVKYIVEDVRRGIAASRNRAVKEAFPSEYHCRIDDDSICEPDYIERLMKIMKDGALGLKPEEIGIVGGLVPYFGGPNIRANSNRLNYFEVINYTPMGIMISDNGGYIWEPEKIMLSHHCRSSYLFRKSAWEKAKGYPEEYGSGVAFREETDFCMKVAYAGFKILTDLGAICWHIRANFGGLRSDNPNWQQAQMEYAQSVQICEQHFQKKFMNLFNTKGDPYKNWRPQNV